jgi:hypothetical protein
MTEPAGIEQADHNMAPEEILAWFLASGRVGELAEWRAAIRAGLSLGFTLPGMYQIHHSMSSAAPLRRPTAASFGEILGRFSERRPPGPGRPHLRRVELAELPKEAS